VHSEHLHWAELVFSLKLNPNVLELAQNCLLSQQSADSIHLSLANLSLRTANRVQELEQALQAHFKQPLKLHFNTKLLNAEQQQQTPAQIRQLRQQQHHQTTLESLEKTPVFQALSRCFSVQVGQLQPRKLD